MGAALTTADDLVVENNDALLTMTGAHRRRSAVRRLLAASVAAICLAPTFASALDLTSFAVLGGSTITNTGSTVINGNVGLSPGTSITGFPPGIVNAPYAVYRNDATALKAQNELTTAYNILANRPVTQDLTSQDLGGLRLTPGVYGFNSAAQLTGGLTLDAQGDPNAVFVFNIGSTLTTATGSTVEVVNTGGALARNVFYRVGSSATLGAATQFQGNIYALSSITMVTAASIDCGSALARNGAVTLDTNTISVCPAAAAVVPVPAPTPTPTPTPTPAPKPAATVIDAIRGAVNSGAPVPLPFVIAPVLLTPAEIAQLSGEVATGAGVSGVRDMDNFMDAVMLKRRRFGPAPMLPPAPTPVAPIETAEAPVIEAPIVEEPATVRVLGYAAEAVPPMDDIFVLSMASDGSAASGTAFDKLFGGASGGGASGEAASPFDPSRLLFWGGGYGGYGVTDGDDAAGTHRRTQRGFGFAAGVTALVTPDVEVGFALGRGFSSYDLSDGFGGGDSKTIHAALHGRIQLDRAYVAAGVGYSHHDISTDRTVTVAGADRFTADFTGRGLSGQIEAGYGFDWLTPYAAVRAHSFKTSAYDETTEQGLSTFALHHDAQTTTSIRTELGARVAHAVMLDDRSSMTLSGGAAWAHYLGSDAKSDASFQALPGSNFTVYGAQRASDALLLNAGVDVALASGVSLGASVDGEFSKDSRSYVGMVRLGFTW